MSSFFSSFQNTSHIFKAFSFFLICLLSISRSDGKVTAENLTVPHKASVPSEKARIESLGGYVFFNRVFGSLAVSRAFGDSKYKQPKTTQNYVSYSPSTKTVQLNRGHRYEISIRLSSFFFFF